MCLARGTVGGDGDKWMRGLSFGFTNPLGTGRVLDVCLCFGCGGVGGVGGSVEMKVALYSPEPCKRLVC